MVLLLLKLLMLLLLSLRRVYKIRKMTTIQGVDPVVLRMNQFVLILHCGVAAAQIQILSPDDPLDRRRIHFHFVVVVVVVDDNADFVVAFDEAILLRRHQGTKCSFRSSCCANLCNTKFDFDDFH